MNRAEKTQLATELKEGFQKSQVTIFVDYKGLKAADADIFRKKVRDTQGEVRVVKNNITRVITKDGSMGDDAKALMDTVVGPTMVVFAYNDPAATAKAVHEFLKDNEALALKDSLLGTKRISAADVEALASLPSREALLSMLLSVMNGPARNFVTVLSAVPRGLVTALAAIRDKKEA